MKVNLIFLYKLVIVYHTRKQVASEGSYAIVLVYIYGYCIYVGYNGILWRGNTNATTTWIGFYCKISFFNGHKRVYKLSI